MLVVNAIDQGVGQIACGGALFRRLVPRRNLRQPEIQNLGVPTLSDKNIGGLDIAMNDSLAVRGVECLGNFDGQPE